MKRLIGILLVAAVVVTMIVVAGAAETEKKIVFTADAAEVKAGDIVTVTLSLEGFEDCDTFMFYDPVYNEEALEWIGGEWMIDGLMSDYVMKSIPVNDVEQGLSGVLYAEEAIDLAEADVATFEFEVLQETGLEEIGFNVIAKNGDAVLSNNVEVVPAEVTLGVEADLWNIGSSNIVLGNELAMWFYVADANLQGSDYIAVVTKSYADGRDDLVVEIPYSEWEATSKNRTRFKFDGIAAKEMSDNISVVINSKSTGKAVSSVYNDSIRSYVERGFESGNAQKNTELATMLVDMLNYGAAAQEMFRYGTYDLANKNMTAYQSYATQGVNCVNNQVKGNGYKSVSLTLESSIQFNMKFFKTNVTQDMTAVVSFTDHYNKPHNIKISGEEFVSDGTTWSIVVDELVVADFSQLVTCTFEDSNGNMVEGISGVDSMESFCARAITGGGGSWYEDIAKFMTAAYNYFH